MKNRTSAWDELKSEAEQGEDLTQQELQPSEETPEVVAGGGKDGIGGIALAVPEVVPTHAMLGFEMTDDRLDGRAAA